LFAHAADVTKLSAPVNTKANIAARKYDFLPRQAQSISDRLLGTTGAAEAQSTDLRAQDADLVVFNAKVYTADSGVPKAEAFAVKADRFVAVGNNADIRALIGKGTQEFDAQQMTVVPGFVDCHNHVLSDDLFTVDKAKIKDIQIVRTVVGGSTAFQA